MAYKLICYDVLAGSTHERLTDGELVREMLTVVEQCENSTVYDDQHPDIARYWKELAIDLIGQLADSEREIDLQYYEYFASEYLENCLPLLTNVLWRDGEWVILPDIGYTLEGIEQGEIASGENVPEVLDSGAVFCEVNDHGNMTLYQGDGYRRPIEVWSVV